MKEAIYKHCVVEGKYGLTIPYLYKAELDKFERRTIREIMEILRDSEEEYFLSYCKELEEFIFGKPYPEKPLDEHFGNLYYADISFDVENFDALVKFIEEEYQYYIDNKLYSKDLDTNIWS